MDAVEAADEGTQVTEAGPLRSEPQSRLCMPLSMS